MLGDILNTVTEAPVIAAFSLTGFVVFFVAMLIWVLRLDPDHIQKMKEMPLDSTASDTQRENLDG